MSRIARAGLLRQLLLRVGVVVLVLLLVSGAISYFVARHYSDEVHDRWLVDSARTLAAQIHFVATRPSLELPQVALEMFIWDEHDEIYYEVMAGEGRRIAGNAAFAQVAIDPARAGGQFFDTAVNGKPVRAVALAVPPDAASRPGTITVIVGETLNKRVRLAREILVATIPVQVLLIVLGGLAVWWSLAGGLRVVAATAEQIRARDPVDPCPVTLPAEAPAEIELLTTAINDLIAKVNEARQVQQRFVANAAHQLRTPVAALQVQIERALRERDPQAQAQALDHVEQAIRRLGHLLHQILVLARIEPNARDRIALVPCDLREIARDAIEQYVDAALARGCDLGYAGPDGSVTVAAEAALLAELIGNLIDNALQYGRAKGRVTVGVVADPARLYVEDDGPGIPVAESNRVFDRFYRLPGSPGFGCGLGLAIVREIAECHGASVSVDPMPSGKGTRVTLRFPVSGRIAAASAMR